LPKSLHPFCENCLIISPLALLPPSEHIHFPRRDQKVERRIHTKVHLDISEEDLGPSSWSSRWLSL
jgi:hypothetical protein